MTGGRFFLCRISRISITFFLTKRRRDLRCFAFYLSTWWIPRVSQLEKYQRLFLCVVPSLSKNYSIYINVFSRIIQVSYIRQQNECRLDKYRIKTLGFTSCHTLVTKLTCRGCVFVRALLPFPKFEDIQEKSTILICFRKANLYDISR